MQSLLNRKQSVAACTPVGHGKSMEHITHPASYIYIENVLIHFGYVQLEFLIASSGLLQSIVLTFRVIRVKAGRGVAKVLLMFHWWSILVAEGVDSLFGCTPTIKHQEGTFCDMLLNGGFDLIETAGLVLDGLFAPRARVGR